VKLKRYSAEFSAKWTSTYLLTCQVNGSVWRQWCYFTWDVCLRVKAVLGSHTALVQRPIVRS